MSWGGQAFLHSLGVLFYITLIALLMSDLEDSLADKPDTFLAPVGFLLLFTLSAAIVGLLVLGRPVMLYLDGKKKEAVHFATATVGFLFIEAIFVFLIIGVMSL